MIQLYPILRRVRRPLLPPASESPKPSIPEQMPLGKLDGAVAKRKSSTPIPPATTKPDANTIP